MVSYHPIFLVAAGWKIHMCLLEVPYIISPIILWTIYYQSPEDIAWQVSTKETVLNSPQAGYLSHYCKQKEIWNPFALLDGKSTSLFLHYF